VQFELKPGSTVQAEVEYRINTFGMRNPEVSEIKTPGVRRIDLLVQVVAGTPKFRTSTRPPAVQHVLDAPRERVGLPHPIAEGDGVAEHGGRSARLL
jgi:hypothetical protein